MSITIGAIITDVRLRAEGMKLNADNRISEDHAFFIIKAVHSKLAYEKSTKLNTQYGFSPSYNPDSSLLQNFTIPISNNMGTIPVTPLTVPYDQGIVELYYYDSNTNERRNILLTTSSECQIMARGPFGSPCASREGQTLYFFNCPNLTQISATVLSTDLAPFAFNADIWDQVYPISSELIEPIIIEAVEILKKALREQEDAVSDNKEQNAPQY